jgi:Glycoside hydrolase family 44
MRLLTLLCTLYLLSCNTPTIEDDPTIAGTVGSSVVYNNALADPWQNWSWGSTIDLAGTGRNAQGIACIVTTAWAGLYLRHDTGLDLSEFNTLRFWIHGGATGGQKLRVMLATQDGKFLEPGLSVTPKANTWTLVSLPLLELGAPSRAYGIIWQDTSGQGVAEFKLDNVFFTRLGNSSPPGGTAEPPLPGRVKVYEDALATGFSSWSWGTNLNPSSTDQRRTGNGLATSISQAWGALYLHTDTTVPSSTVNTLRFWIHGGSSGNQKLRVLLADASNQTLEPGVAVVPVANTWTLLEIPFAQLGQPDEVSGIIWQDTSGAGQSGFYLDDISFYQNGPVTPPVALTLTVDAAQKRAAISPDIYGISFANESLSKDLRLPLRRYGGNAVTRYNWKIGNTNRASDYFFLSSIFPNENANTFIDQDRRTNTSTFLTVPTIGWVTKSSDVSCGFSVAKYGPQEQTDPSHPDCGNGLKPDKTKIVGNDPRDTSIAVGADFVGEWVGDLVSRYGQAKTGGIKYYALDNEPALWNSTHRDVHPEPVGYDELLSRTLEYAKAIKNADSSAQIVGPAEWGWSNYLFSAKDVAAGGNWWDTRPDRMAHGDQELMAWYLAQLRQAEQSGGKRLLDYLDLHFYPQANNVYSDSVDAATRALRLRTTRGLWDLNYKDESWIAESVHLIPRMKQWVTNNYPNTKIAIGEYNFGGLKDVNGALAQADALGIFGREGADMAVLWGMPDGDQIPGAQAFRMYRNYDGLGSGFGETSLSALSSDQAKISVFAAQRQDNAMTIIVINKLERARAVTLNVQNATTSNAVLYRYSAASPNAIVKEGTQTLTAGVLTTTLPASSISLYVLK